MACTSCSALSWATKTCICIMIPTVKAFQKAADGQRKVTHNGSFRYIVQTKTKITMWTTMAVAWATGRVMTRTGVIFPPQTGIGSRLQQGQPSTASVTARSGIRRRIALGCTTRGARFGCKGVQIHNHDTRMNGVRGIAQLSAGAKKRG